MLNTFEIFQLLVLWVNRNPQHSMLQLIFLANHILQPHGHQVLVSYLTVPAPALSRLSSAAPEFLPGSSALRPMSDSARAYQTGTIVHLSRPPGQMCGYFTTRRLEDGSTKTFYNGYFGFVRPDGALVNAEGICFDDLFLHPSDVADDYNPAVGDRVTFRRGTHNGRAKAVEVVATAEAATIERLLAAGGWVRVGSRWLPLE